MKKKEWREMNGYGEKTENKKTKKLIKSDNGHT